MGRRRVIGQHGSGFHFVLQPRLLYRVEGKVDAGQQQNDYNAAARGQGQRDCAGLNKAGVGLRQTPLRPPAGAQQQSAGQQNGEQPAAAGCQNQRAADADDGKANHDLGAAQAGHRPQGHQQDQGHFPVLGGDVGVAKRTAGADGASHARRLQFEQAQPRGQRRRRQDFGAAQRRGQQGAQRQRPGQRAQPRLVKSAPCRRGAAMRKQIVHYQAHGDSRQAAQGKLERCVPCDRRQPGGKDQRQRPGEQGLP